MWPRYESCLAPDFAALTSATAGLEPPFAVVDLDAFDANAADLVRRGGGKPIRLATKSVRCRKLSDRALAIDGFRGVLAFTLPEALWLAGAVGDVVVAYPTVDRKALQTLGSAPNLADRVTLMADSVEQLDMMVAAVTPGVRIRVCLDMDSSMRVAGGRVHLGVRRSPLHSVEQVVAFARAVLDRRQLRLVGVMSYEAQIAGVADAAGPVARQLVLRGMQASSARELRGRRAEAVAAVRALTPLEFVNGGGSGSVQETAAEEAVTEIAAGSALFVPALFDGYRSFTPRPSAFFVLSVVRRPAPDIATVLGGGWVASGAAGADRLPKPVWPQGLSLLAREGAGEVQTPLIGPGASDLRVGDRVWFRHAKAGELCERVEALHLVSNGRVIDAVPTYRGEGKAFL